MFARPTINQVLSLERTHTSPSTFHTQADSPVSNIQPDSSRPGWLGPWFKAILISGFYFQNPDTFEKLS